MTLQKNILLFALMCVGALCAHAETVADITRSREAITEALKARKENRPADYLRQMNDVFSILPNMPRVILRMAGALSLNSIAPAPSASTPPTEDATAASNREQALRLLEQLARMGLAFNISGDPDFAPIKDDPRFAAVQESMAANQKPFVKSSTAFELAEKDFLPEGIAFDEATRTFYIGSVHRRKIVKRLWTGAIKPLSLPADNLWSVLAIAVDSRRQLLWAASAALDQTAGIDEKDIGRTAIFKYDLAQEKLLAKYELPRTATKRSFGDLLIARSGEVYISESLEGVIYRITGKKLDRLETFIAAGTFSSPQGMVWRSGANPAAGKGVGAGPAGNSEKWLYVADYTLGLMRVSMHDRRVEWLPPPDGATLAGLDGLARIDAAGNRLVATQNGIIPHRVVEIALDGAGQVGSVTRLEANHPLHREPTLGVVVGGDFYYVANSQWDMFERGKSPPMEKLAPPLILRLPLAPSSVTPALPAPR